LEGDHCRLAGIDDTSGIARTVHLVCDTIRHVRSIDVRHRRSIQRRRVSDISDPHRQRILQRCVHCVGRAAIWDVDSIGECCARNHIAQTGDLVNVEKRNQGLNIQIHQGTVDDRAFRTRPGVLIVDRRMGNKFCIRRNLINGNRVGKGHAPPLRDVRDRNSINRVGSRDGHSVRSEGVCDKAGTEWQRITEKEVHPVGGA